MLDGAARTAQQAADALGVALGQIAKSIIFRREGDGEAVLVIASGDRRVDEHKVQALVGAIGRADASFVKACTGFSIGGVAPVAHACAPVTLIDRELLRFEVIWAAAGHPHAVFQLHPQDLVALTDAPLADVTQGLLSAQDAIKLIADRACQLRAKGEFDADFSGPVPSPCISVCRMTPDRSRCVGCFRTIEEIRAWSGAAPPQRRAIWAALMDRAGLPAPRELLP